jgi:Putative adhesin
MTETPGTGTEELVRRQSYDVDGPVELDLGTGPGRIEVRLADDPGVHVEVRHEPHGGNPFAQGMSNLMSWIGTQFGNLDTAEDSLAAEAVRQTRIDFTAGRLVVRTPKDMHLRNVAIAVSVQAPVGSQVAAKSGSGDLSVSGAVGRLELHTGSGRISTDQASAQAKVETGSGVVRLGPMTAGVRVKSGSGDVEVSAIGGASTVITGSGDVWLGAVSDDALVRTGSGDVTIANASAGQLELHSGSGAIRIGVREGSPAEIDLSSGSGDVRSDLTLSTTPPESAPPLRIRGRTGSGSGLVTTAID